MPICKFCGEEFELSDARRRIGRSYGAGIYNEYYPNGDVCESCAVEYSAVAEPPNLMK